MCIGKLLNVPVVPRSCEREKGSSRMRAISSAAIFSMVSPPSAISTTALDQALVSTRTCHLGGLYRTPGGVAHISHILHISEHIWHTAVHIVCISMLYVSLVYRPSCVHITPYMKIRHHIAIISVAHIYHMVRGHMPTYHGLSNIQTNRPAFFDFQYTVFYTDMPQRFPISHR